MRLRFAALAIVVVSVGQVSVALADAPSERISVSPSTCGDLPWASDAWADLLRVELAADGTRTVVVPAGEPTPPDAPRVRLEPDACNASARSATLTLETGTQRIERAVDLTQVEPRSRARVLALAAAELVHTARARLALVGKSANLSQELSLRIEVVTTSNRSFGPNTKRPA